MLCSQREFSMSQQAKLIEQIDQLGASARYTILSLSYNTLCKLQIAEGSNFPSSDQWLLEKLKLMLPVAFAERTDEENQEVYE